MNWRVVFFAAGIAVGTIVVGTAAIAGVQAAMEGKTFRKAVNPVVVVREVPTHLAPCPTTGCIRTVVV